MSYTLQVPFWKELGQLYQKQIIVPIRVDEMHQLLVPKPNGTICQCKDLARLNQALIRPVHGGPTVNDMFPMITSA